jgi:tetratricopeptide (TPR) repeat protein
VAGKSKRAKDVAKPDEFLSTSIHAMSWLEQRRRQALTILGVLVAGGVAFTLWTDLSKNSAAKAGRLMAAALEAEQAEVVTEPPATDENNEDPPLSFRTEKQRAQTVVRRYKRVLARYSEGELGAHAHMGLAGAYLTLGKLADAQREYQAALDAHQEDVEPFALEGIAYTFEARGKLDEARHHYDDLKTMRDGAYRYLADYHLARLDIAQGKKAEALELLKNVRQNLPGNPDLPYLREQTEARIADLEAEGIIAAGDDHGGTKAGPHAKKAHSGGGRSKDEE